MLEMPPSANMSTLLGRFYILHLVYITTMLIPKFEARIYLSWKGSYIKGLKFVMDFLKNIFKQCFDLSFNFFLYTLAPYTLHPCTPKVGAPNSQPQSKVVVH